METIFQTDCDRCRTFIRKDGIPNSFEFEIFYQRKIIEEILRDNVVDWYVKYVKSEKNLCNMM